MWKVSALSWLGSFCSSYALLFFSSLEHFFRFFFLCSSSFKPFSVCPIPFFPSTVQGLKGMAREGGLSARNGKRYVSHGGNILSWSPHGTLAPQEGVSHVKESGMLQFYWGYKAQKVSSLSVFRMKCHFLIHTTVGLDLVCSEVRKAEGNQRAKV